MREAAALYHKWTLSDPDSAIDGLIAAHGLPTALLYFASPKIFHQKGATFDYALYQQFYSYYVDGAYRLYQVLRSYDSKHNLLILNPSSVAIADPVKGLAEYSAAKVASEIMYQHIERFDRATTVLQVRLPRIETDKTTTLVPVPAAKAENVLLPVLRELFQITVC